MADDAVTGIPGWSKFETRAASIWLPESWFGGDPKSDKRRIRERAKALGPTFRRTVAALERSAFKTIATIVLIAVDSERASTCLTINVEKLSLLKRGTTLERYMRRGLKEFPKSMLVLESGVVRLEHGEVGRTLAAHRETKAFRKPGSTLSSVLQFNVKEDRDFVNVSYTVAADDLESSPPIFERSFRTFRWNSQDSA
jgi:hypothetical protein